LKLYAGDFPRFQRTSAYIHALRLTVNENPHLLYVYTPRTAVTVVRVRYMVAGSRFLAGNIAYSGHCRHHPSVANMVINIAYAGYGSQREMRFLERAVSVAFIYFR